MNRAQVVEQLPGLRRYARALTGNAWAADDLMQDTLERACRKWLLWRGGSDLRAWLFGIMHNLRIDQLRRGGLATTSLDDEEAAEVPVRATQSDHLEVMDLESALRQVPEEQRQILLLVVFQHPGLAQRPGACA